MTPSRPMAMELRIARMAATLGFFIAVTLVMATFAGVWGYVLGALLFGAMTGFLWWSEARAREQEQVRAQQEQVRLAQEGRAAHGQQSPPSGSAQWS